MKEKSYAKINLILEIIRKRQDGFHEIKSIMQTVSLYDELFFSRTDSDQIEFECDNQNAGMGTHNLVYRAAERFFKKTGERPSVHISLKKKIPISSGLGGGSSNAATALKALNTMWGSPLNRAQLMDLAAELGSDVPFFLEGGTALAEGRGEKITPLPFVGRLEVLLLNPGFPVSTAKVYSKFNLSLTSPGGLLNILPVFLTGGMSGNEICANIHNDLQNSVFGLFPEIGQMQEWLISQGANAACVSGSGGTVFGLFQNAKCAAEAVQNARRIFPWASLVCTVQGTC